MKKNGSRYSIQSKELALHVTEQIFVKERGTGRAAGVKSLKFA